MHCNTTNVILNVLELHLEVMKLKEVIMAYLRENIDEHAQIDRWNGQVNLPLILIEKYSFFEVSILNNRCVLVEELEESSSIIEMKKHIKLIIKKNDVNVVFLLKTISQFKRKNMIKERIPFVVENGQMYLPFLGLDLSQETKAKLKKVDVFSGIVQMAYLYFLYDEKLEINATELADKFGISKMHAVRTLNVLYDLGLLIYTVGGKTGRSKNYRRISNPEYYQAGKDYLRNPVQKRVFVKAIDKSYPYAGLDALARISMLNPSLRTMVAISKSEFENIKFQVVEDSDRIKNEYLIEVQVWAYDPMFFSKNDIVDILSLAKSIEHIKDERVEKETIELLEGESWYTE